jgi:hypothetical protein
LTFITEPPGLHRNLVFDALDSASIALPIALRLKDAMSGKSDEQNAYTKSLMERI